jgi:hypothetical protein
MRDGLRSRAPGKAARGINRDGAISTGVDQPSAVSIDRTDYSLWRLKVKHGRQTWHYITPEESKTWSQSIPEKYHLGLDTVPLSRLLY